MLAAALCGAACRTDRANPKPPSCTEPGEPDPNRTVGTAVGRYQLDLEGCLFVDVSEDGGVRRTATEGFHAGVWRVHFEQLVGPGQVVENTDSDADGRFETREVSRFTDGGWQSTETETPELRYRRTRIDAERMRVVRQSLGPDGGWQVDEDVEAAIQQR